MMNKQEAIEAMKAGEKVTHTYFSPNEYMTISDNKILTEDGYKHKFIEFWSYRDAEGWNEGYSIYKPTVKDEKEAEEKKVYAKIQFINCQLEYSYTICPWSEVETQIQAAESDFEGTNENDEEKPEINITTIFLTDSEWDEEFKSWG